MKEYRSLVHTKWCCKYHVAFIPKRRRKVSFGELRSAQGKMLHELAWAKRSFKPIFVTKGKKMSSMSNYAYLSHPGRFDPGGRLKHCGWEAYQVFMVSMGVWLLSMAWGRCSL
jgi:hypothetical protein